MSVPFLQRGICKDFSNRLRNRVGTDSTRGGTTPTLIALTANTELASLIDGRQADGPLDKIKHRLPAAHELLYENKLSINL